VISSTENSLGKIFIPKKTYLEYLLEGQKKNLAKEDSETQTPNIKGESTLK